MEIEKSAEKKEKKDYAELLEKLIGSLNTYKEELMPLIQPQ
jgi:hypothetical protein